MSMPRHTLLALTCLITLAACGSDKDPTPQAPIDQPADLPPSQDQAPAPDLSQPDMSELPDEGVPLPYPELNPLRTAILEDIKKNNATGASVAIWRNDEIIWVGGFGYTDPLDKQRAPDEQTQFMIGSDTKKIASIAYLQLVAKGQASLETTIAQTLPELSFPSAPRFTQATAHHLMSHQGGLRDDTGDYSSQTEDAALRRFISTTLKRAPALAPPGAFHNYSNPNYSLLGLMTETIAAQPWADLVQAEVFAPLEMTRTVARKSSVDPTNYAAGFGQANPQAPNLGPVYLDQLWEDAFVRPAGLVWSTPTDQMKLARFLVDGDPRVLSDELRQQITTAQAPIYPDLPGAYGYGVMLDSGVQLGNAFYPSVKVWSHGGNTTTHTSSFMILPEQRFAISILSNGLQDDFTLSLVTAFSTLVELPAKGDSPPLPFNPEELTKLEGAYIDPNNVGRVQISRQGNALRIKLPDLEAGQVPYQEELNPISTRVWILRAAGQELVISFFEADDGTMYIANRAFVATRAPGAMALSAPIDLTNLKLDLRPNALDFPALRPLAPRR